MEFCDNFDDGRSLKHHGILGQKWGVQNGPPYPLSESMSDRIKRSKEKILENPVKKDNDRVSIKFNDEQKKAIAIGAAAIGAMYLEYRYGAISETSHVLTTTDVYGLKTGFGDAAYRFAKIAKGEDPSKYSQTERYISARNENAPIDKKNWPSSDRR